MALEHWALGQLDKGRALDDVVHDVLEGHDGCAALGIAVSLILKVGCPTPVGVAIIGSSRIWSWDLHRWQHDRGMPINLIAFSSSPGSLDHRATLDSNALPFRRGTLRDLAPLFVLAPTKRSRPPHARRSGLSRAHPPSMTKPISKTPISCRRPSEPARSGHPWQTPRPIVSARANRKNN